MVQPSDLPVALGYGLVEVGDLHEDARRREQAGTGA